jgi:PAS domain S-box-containing protein
MNGERSFDAGRHWRDFFENAPIGLQWVGSDGKVLWANQAQVELLGYSKHDYIGSHISRFHADPSVWRSFLERLMSGETLRDYAAPLVRRDGAIRHVLIHANAYHEQGRFVHTRCFVRDVTDHKRAEDELSERARSLAEADRLKDEFLATLSHELRTPLNAILGWARLLRTGNVDARKRDDAVATIERNAAAQARLIDELLDVARILNGKLSLDMRALDLGEVVRSAVESARPIVEGKRLRLTAAVEPHVGPFVGDRTRLGQVLANLIGNSVKFTPAGGEVHVSLSRVDDHAHIVVCDTGIGIASEIIGHVFERFRQGDAGVARAYGGLGLGLAIVRHLVELHGGSVEVTSAGVGQGATFSVLLPLLGSGHPESAEPERPAPPRALDGLRVLVVDDEPDAAELCSEVLRQAGATVATAGSVAEARAALARAVPDVLLSDIGLPHEDGYSFIEEVRAGGAALPAIALTAYARAEDQRRSRESGFDEHVAKPIDPQALVAVVAAVVARRR